MIYKKQNFKDGDILNASQLNNIEDGVAKFAQVLTFGNHYLNRPYSFSGKKAAFFGDSITYGYTQKNSGRATNGGFPKLFSDRVGMTFSNLGVSGATLGGKKSGYGYIPDNIKNATLSNYDFIFIAGGINDWQLAVDKTSFKDGLVALCEYLKDNYTGEVIFINPINHAGRQPMVRPQPVTVQEYRDIITETILLYGFSLVQGGLFNFPTESNTASFKTALVGTDLLHPTELGYEIYAKSLATVLC